jgi:hypothetical protein
VKALAAIARTSLLALVPGCGGGGSGGEPPSVNPAAFVAGVDHSYFPMSPGTHWVLEGEDEGLPAREEIRVLDETRLLAGVECTGLLEEIFVGGVLVERTTEWYAQDRHGSVWKFGEETFEWDGVAFVLGDDSWEVGAGDAVPWLAFPADPHAGDTFTGYRPGGTDVFHVVSTTETATVPAGVFVDCLQLLENPDDPEDTDVILYAPGVGRVSERSTTGRLELVSMAGA